MIAQPWIVFLGLGVAAVILALLALLYLSIRDRDHLELENNDIRSLLTTARMLVAEFREAELDERAPRRVPPATLSLAGAWIERVDEVRRVEVP